jgi:hypothetical protein
LSKKPCFSSHSPDDGKGIFMKFMTMGYQKNTAGMRSGVYTIERKEMIHRCWATFQDGCQKQVSDAACLLTPLHNPHFGWLSL